MSLLTIPSFLVTIAILVVVHELGHYLAARLCGVKVLKFSIGFGKPLISRRLGQDRTEWAVGMLPLGGYVKMLDEREGKVAQEEVHRSFNRASVWRRIVIVIAGPLANFLLAVVIFWGLFIVGVAAVKPIIGEPEPQTPAALAELRNGDEIVSVDGERVATFTDLRRRLIESAVKREKPVIELANGEKRELDFSRIDSGDIEDSAKIGITPFSPALPPVVGRVEPGGAAEKGGLKPGDRILLVNGKVIQSWQDFARQVRASPGKEIEVTVKSGTIKRLARMTPAWINDNGTVIGRVGASPQIDPALFDSLRTELRYGPLEAFGQAVTKTWEAALFNLEMLGRMAMGQVSWRNLSGPISIADYAGQTAQQGSTSFLNFIAILSIGLGVINLLPIPPLDGGHLVYYIFEVFRGRPVSESVMDIVTRVGMVVLGTLILLALYNDLLRVFT